MRAVWSVCYKTLLALPVRGFLHAGEKKESCCETQ